MYTPLGSQFIYMGNLRVCSDCHPANRIVSKMTERDIVAMDAYCIQNCKDGNDMCFCDNY